LLPIWLVLASFITSMICKEKLVSTGWYGRVYALTSFGLRFIRACDCNLNNELAAYEKEFEKESAEMRAAEKEKN